MPRLDVWLIEEERFSSRQAAKRAIKSGQVLVNGMTSKPSYQVKRTDTIEILDDFTDMPVGFSKLQGIDRLLKGQLVSKNGMALDIGSSAGGFLLYLAENGIKEAIGVEVSKRFSENLFRIAERYPNISIILDDAFIMDPNIITTDKSLDILLVDVTTNPEGTQSLVEKFSPLLKSNGIMIAAIKYPFSDDIAERMKFEITDIGYQNVTALILDSTRQEFHIVGYRM
jgi:predicted rRNA methylase YqxC with S4 and FtsJ domains